MGTNEILIAIIIAGVVLVAFYAIAKGRGFRFAAQRGKTKLEMDITGKQEEDSASSSETGSIKDVSVLDQGKVESSDNVSIHIGHETKEKKD
jgi:hypothetical protein